MSVLEDINKAFKAFPQVKEYAMDYIRDHARSEAITSDNSKALMGKLERVFVTDMVTYIGSPDLAREVLGRLIRKHGSYALERAMKQWVLNNYEELCQIK